MSGRANGWKTPFNADRMKGVKLVGDLIDAKTGSVMAEAGTKITPRLARKLIEQGLEEHSSRRKSWPAAIWPPT